MKILLVNPQFDAQRNIEKALPREGVALLFPEDGQEAWQMLQLHGDSVDLAIVHREGLSDLEGKADTEQSLRWIAKVRSDPRFLDLPVILTTSEWSTEDCARHQTGPAGVNGYLCSPWEESQVVDLIEAILGQPLRRKTHSSPPEPPELPVEEVSPGISPIVLEDSNSIYGKNEGSNSISLTAPDEGNELEIPHESSEIESFASQEPADNPVSNINTNSDSISISEDALDPNFAEGFTLVQSAPAVTSIELAVSEEPTPEEAAPEEEGAAGLQIESFSIEVPQEVAHEIPHEISEDLQSQPVVSIESQDLAQQMPYLFKDASHSSQTIPASPQLPESSPFFNEPIGDAIVPGGVAHAPDVETIKKFLLLREQDVGILSNQLKGSQGQIQQLEKMLAEEKAKNRDLMHGIQEHQRKIDQFEESKQSLIDRFEMDIKELNFQLKVRQDQSRIYERQILDAADQMERIKERVRIDIRKIRIREKELENRLEIVKKDSEVLIGAREGKIIELKRKLDLLEFNLDLLQEQFARERENSAKLKERLAKAAQASKVAMGLLELTPIKGTRIETMGAKAEAHAEEATPSTTQDNKLLKGSS